MPIYEYRCDACKNVFEEWRRHADDMTEVPCPECKETAHRLISNTSFVLKGGGWYVTEYGNRKTESAPAAGTDKDAAPAKTESAATPTPEAAPAPATPAAPSAKPELAAAS